MKAESVFSTLMLLIFAAMMTLSPAECMARENDAMKILKAMSDYLAEQKTIQLTFDSDIEVITPQLEKIQFTNSGSALLQRPSRLRAHRMGGYHEAVDFKSGLIVALAVAGWACNGKIRQIVKGNLVGTAEARMGRPATPVSYAGVARRSTVGAGAPGAGVRPGAGAGGVGGPASGVGVRPGAGQAGVGYSRGAGANLGGPRNRVGIR